jgi:glycogen debranching enzyme
MNVVTTLEHAANGTDDAPIPGSISLQEQRSHTLKQGDMFAIFNEAGNIPVAAGAPEGIFYRDTRYLSLLDMRIAGQGAMLLSSKMRDDNATLTCELTNPDLKTGGSVTLDRNLIHLRRTKFLFDGASYERLAIKNFSTETTRFTIEFRFASDFADLFEVRGRVRDRRGEIHPPLLGAEDVVLSYTGLDAVKRETRIRFDPAPAVLEAHRAVFDIDLSPGGRVSLHLDITCDQPAAARPPRERFYVALRDARRALRGIAGAAASVDSDNEVFNEASRRCIADLAMLITETPQGPFPYAGIPWFSTAFGRDALVTALLMLWMDPSVARGVLRFLANRQATTFDAASDAEPGKILHEMRQGEMAELGEIPYKAYYGSVDSTPLFVMLAGAYLDRTADIETLLALWPNIQAALHWIDNYGDPDGDGFVEYFRQTENGLANQGWKDSADSVFHADGALAVAPIALCEVQGYVFAAKQAASRIARACGDTPLAEKLAAEAEAMRQRIETAFWCEDVGTYGIALDRDKRACRVRSSNAGHLLLTGVPSAERATRVARQLLESNSFSGFGIRTIAAGEARFNPMSYHNGSVWPHDNALIGIGLARYGLRAEAARLLEGLFEASVAIDLRRLPELVCGFARRDRQGPTFYPVACAPQAWAAAALPSLLQSCLGLSFDPARRVVMFENPVLPRFLDRVVLRGLVIGEATIDVALQRAGVSVAMAVLGRSGDIRAMMTN